MPICANDAADMDSRTNANNSVRMKRICIVFPLARLSFACPVSLSVCGLRGLKGTISERNVLKTPSRSQMVLGKTFSFRRYRSLCKKAHFEHPSHQFPVVGSDESERDTQIASRKAGS